MANRVAHGTEIAQQSWFVVRKNRQLEFIPLIAVVSQLLLVLVIAVVAFASGLVSYSFSGTGRYMPPPATAIWFVIAFIYFFLNHTIIIFTNTALVGAVLKLSRGEKASVAVGFAIARARLRKILIYALMSATVGLLARSLLRSGRQSSTVAASLLAAMGGAIILTSWNVIVIFAVPVLVAEDKDVIESLKRSLELFRKTWGEGFMGHTVIQSISFVTFSLISITGSVVVAWSIVNQVIVLAIVAVVFVIIMIGRLVVIRAAINAVFQASLYQYATTGDAGPFISNEYAAAAFGIA